MTVGERMAAEAQTAIAAMKAAATEARRLHARAELVRHMIATARKQTGARAEAVRAISGEWMKAWSLGGYPALAAEVEGFTGACLDAVREPGKAAEARLAAALAALDAALEALGTTLADEMAWRSECAHGWWGAVVPVPSGRGYPMARPTVPQPQPGLAFWEAGAEPHCGAG